MDTKTQKRKRLKQLCSDYDAAVKRILTKKYVLAHIPKGCTEEFSDCSIEEIVEKHLTFDPIYGETTVDEDETNAELAAKVTSSEHATTSEGKVVFDTRFEVLAPNTKRPIGLIINIEGQRQSKLRYPRCFAITTSMSMHCEFSKKNMVIQKRILNRRLL